MKRIGILTAGGDTPALNATIYGAAQEANRRNIELVGLVRGYAGLLDDGVPHVLLNPLFTTIPELDPCKGGTLIGSSRTYIKPNSPEITLAEKNLRKLGVDGLICIGGDGTINGMQPFAKFMPCVLAPKTIDNDLGLNYVDEPNDWYRKDADNEAGYVEEHRLSRDQISLDDVVNYATPGYATAVYVVASSIQRIRSTAESHRRIAVIEVMGRQSGYIALGAAYGQPDIILIPEVPVDLDKLEHRVRYLYDLQHHVILVVGEGVRSTDGIQFGARTPVHDPAGNIRFSGAADALADVLSERINDELVSNVRTHEPKASAIFTRKIGHTQRGGRPILFDRFHGSQLGGRAVALMADGQTNVIATIEYDTERGFGLGSVDANRLRDRWGEIHPRIVHPSMYDERRMQVSGFGQQYLRPIFTNAIGWDDVEFMRTELFSPGNLSTRYQSVNIDMRKRIRYV